MRHSLLLAASLYSQSSIVGRLRAGAAKVDITPKESDLATATDSIRDHLFVRAIVVDDGTTCGVLVGMDLGGAANQIVDDATSRASKASGMPRPELHHLRDPHTQLQHARLGRPWRSDD